MVRRTGFERVDGKKRGTGCEMRRPGFGRVDGRKEDDDGEEEEL
jgi:hypothetical protein